MKKASVLAIAIALLLCAGGMFRLEPAGAMSMQPAYVYLLKQTELYGKPSAAAKPVAALKAGQTVRVVGSERGRNRDLAESEIEWLQVQTWIGAKWIRADAERLTSGDYRKLANQALTLVAPESSLYDQPDERYSSGRTIGPQTVRATASFDYQPIYFSNATAFVMSTGRTWYRVDTPQGPKWLLNPMAPETVQEKPYPGTVKLTGQETAYPYPFAVEGEAEAVEPQAVQTLALWTTGVGPWQTSWLKIRLPQGDRWIVPKHAVWTNYKVMNQTLVLRTDAKTYSDPKLAPAVMTETYPFPTTGAQAGKTLLKAGSYQAFEAAGDWVHLHTPDRGDVWVNPQQALLERPVGIVPTDEKIQLAKMDEYYAYPNSSDRTHAKGFYKPQTVTAFEKWTDSDGTVWYHFHGFGADEWVKRPGGGA